MAKQSIEKLPDHIAAKLSCLEEIRVKHRNFEYALMKIEERRLVGLGMNKPSNLLILGESGAGKTTLSEEIVSMHQSRRIRTDGILKIPVIYCKVPAQASPLSVAREIMRALIKDFDPGGNLDRLTNSIIKLIRTCEVELILIDEVQELAEGRSYNPVRKAANWLKQLNERASTPLIFLGTGEAIELLSINEQLERRVAEAIDLADYDPSNPDDLSAFRNILLEIERQLPFEKPSNLADPDIARGLMKSSRGLIGRLVDFLKDAGVVAISNNRKCITKSDLRETFARRIQSKEPNTKNPF